MTATRYRTSRPRREPPKHFLDHTKFPGGEIRCGVSLPTIQSEWARRSTKDPKQVTCAKCLRLMARDRASGWIEQ